MIEGLTPDRVRELLATPPKQEELSYEVDVKIREEAKALGISVRQLKIRIINHHYKIADRSRKGH